MSKNSDINKIKKISKLINEFTDIYNDKISGALANNDITFEEISKISSLWAKNIPEIIKLQNNLNDIINSDKSRNEIPAILKIINSDQNARNHLDNLLDFICCKYEN